MEVLTADRVRAVLDYNPETGIFMWANRPLSDFANTQAYGAFVSRCLGREAGSPTMNGYRRITVDRVKYLAHRLAWLHFYGTWPSQQIDHVNGDGCDNRIANLRDVSNAENHRNLRLMKTNRSGVAGVRFDARYDNWAATIWEDAKIIHLGSFKSKDDAVAARKAAERKLGYHPNHGRAA
ncbi:MAG: HNH endonuclease [Mesorhizobium sp.]|uniref:HNH endonuclease signature motif containing protein n=1 Tax=Mesorhizobium sp. TaxID=1871066 RepID=UPI0011FCEA4A|nr:HNH endonuclease signature motif containing protein [Mesorhizobium sp.]TIV83829.1 MAG: HNH endonuclease [Mesorhizobium sp.]